MEANRNPWSVLVKHALLDRGMSQEELAAHLGYKTRSYVSSAINNPEKYRNAVRKISDYLRIPDYDG